MADAASTELAESLAKAAEKAAAEKAAALAEQKATLDSIMDAHKSAFSGKLCSSFDFAVQALSRAQLRDHPTFLYHSS